MGHWDGMEDRAGYLAWFDARKDFQVFRDLDVEVGGWKMTTGSFLGQILCPDCFWGESLADKDAAQPDELRSVTACGCCGQSLNAKGDVLLKRARVFTEAAGASGIGGGDTGSDDGSCDATGYTAIWLQRKEDKVRLFALAEEHGFELDGSNEWGDGVLYHFVPKE